MAPTLTFCTWLIKTQLDKAGTQDPRLGPFFFRRTFDLLEKQQSAKFCKSENMEQVRKLKKKVRKGGADSTPRLGQSSGRKIWSISGFGRQNLQKVQQFTSENMEILLKNSGQEKNLYSNNDQQMGEWVQTPHLDFKGILQQPKYSFQMHDALKDP